jgi:hypothetical protein
VPCVPWLKSRLPSFTSLALLENRFQARVAPARISHSNWIAADPRIGREGPTEGSDAAPLSRLWASMNISFPIRLIRGQIQISDRLSDLTAVGSDLIRFLVVGSICSRTGKLTTSRSPTTWRRMTNLAVGLAGRTLRSGLILILNGQFSTPNQSYARLLHADTRRGHSLYFLSRCGINTCILLVFPRRFPASGDECKIS